MVSRFIALAILIHSSHLFSSTWDLNKIDETRASCPRTTPPSATDVMFEVYGSNCSRLRQKASATNCISESTLKKMELCNIVPICLSSQLLTWIFCSEYSLLDSQTSLFENCERQEDCQFAQNCLLPRQVYALNRPFEMEFKVRYAFMCKTSTAIPLRNIGLETENGFKPFEQTLDAIISLIGKEYFRLIDLNPELTRSAGLDRDCSLSFHTIETNLSPASRKIVLKNLANLQFLSDSLRLLRSADKQIVDLLSIKSASGFNPINELNDVLETARSINANIPIDDSNKAFFELAINRIQRLIQSIPNDSPPPESLFDDFISQFSVELEKRTNAFIKKINELHLESLLMLNEDKEFSAQYMHLFNEARSVLE